MSKRLLVTIAGPLTLHETIGIATADLRSTVGAERVDNHDLITPSNAFKTILDAIFLVETHHYGRYRGQ